MRDGVHNNEREYTKFELKGCFNIKKSKQKVAAIVILIVILLSIFAVGLSMFMSDGSDGSAATEPGFTFPEIGINGTDGYKENLRADASIPAVTGVTLTSGATTQSVELYNPSDNPCVFVISLYLGNGQKLFQTAPIMPGESVNSVELELALKSGTYQDAVLVYDCFTADGSLIPLTRCELVVDISSV